MALKTLLLLTRQEEYPYLRDWLSQGTDTLSIVWTPTLTELAAVSGDVLADARLISFCTNVIVPKAVLTHLGHGAYNFHPGPPAYPGTAPATFALYNGAAVFGVTLHEMEERVDAGPIVDFDVFAIPENIGLQDLEQMAYAALIRLFRRHIPALVRAQLLLRRNTLWGAQKSSRRGYARLCDIPSDIGAAELDRRVRALGRGDGHTAPTVTLHGHRFQLIVDEQATAEQAGAV